MAILEKSLNDILTDIKPKAKRQEELIQLMPNLKEGKKVYYSGQSYVLLKDDEIYSGTENGRYETRANMGFPFVFFLTGIYVARYGASLYNENENMQNDKTLSIDENGLLVLKDYGVVGSESMIKDILSSYEENEENAEEIINQYISDAEKEMELLTEGMVGDLEKEEFEIPKPKKNKNKSKETSKKKSTKKASKKSKKK